MLCGNRPYVHQSYYEELYTALYTFVQLCGCIVELDCVFIFSSFGNIHICMISVVQKICLAVLRPACSIV